MNPFLAVLALAGLSFAPQSPSAPARPAAEQAPAAKVALLDKIAVIGASLSAGFHLDGNENMLAESKIRLADVIAASLVGPHQPIEDRATMMFFMEPTKHAKTGLTAFKNSQPTAIVALDYLFWFGYGRSAEDKRIDKLNKALDEIAGFTCPILLGDLPDMSAATKVAEPMLLPMMVPAPETLKLLNERIVAWCKEHKNVVLVPLAEITKKLQGDQELIARGNTWPKGSIDRLMQKDRLHTTLEGTCAVWVVAVDAWLGARKELTASAFELDAKKLVDKIQASKAEAKPEPMPKEAPK